MKTITATLILTLASQGFVCAAKSMGQTPRQPFTVTISAPEKVQAGNPVQLSIQLTNTSDHDMMGTVTYGNGVWLAFHYSVTRLDGGTPRPLQAHFAAVQVGSAVGSNRTRPGEKQGGVAYLDSIFDMPVGTYAVQVSRKALDASGHPTGEVVKSNTVTITIVPPPFSMKISMPKVEVKAGSPAHLDIRITNISKSDLAFEAPPEQGVDTHFWYSCLKEGDGDTSRSGTLVPSNATLTLKPGDTHEWKVDLAAGCDLGKPGSYRIRVVRSDPGDPTQGSVSSNEINLTVMP